MGNSAILLLALKLSVGDMLVGEASQLGDACLRVSTRRLSGAMNN